MYANIYLLRDTGQYEPLTYSVPAAIKQDITIGKLVEVPFRNHREKGIIWSIHNNTPSFTVKNIGAISSTVLLTPQYLQIIEAFSIQNLCNISRVLPLFLPKRILETNGESPKQEAYILLPSSSCSGTARKFGKKQQEALDLFKSEGETLHISTFIEKNISRPILKKLEEKGRIQKTNIEKFPIPSQNIYLKKKSVSEKNIYIGSTHSARNAKVFEHITRTIKKGQQVLFLIPEYFSLSKKYEIFQNLFGTHNVTSVSGKSTHAQKHTTWWKAKRCTPHIFIGTRSSLFLPFCNIGLIVIEDVQDNSYKNDKMPRYHTREAALLVSEYTGTNIIFSTACPDSETLYVPSRENHSELLGHDRKKNGLEHNNTKKSIITTFQDPLPEAKIIDMRIELSNGNTSPISVAVQNAIQKTQDRGKKTMLYLNRRGLFRVIVCNACGHIPKCPLCHSSLAVHEKKNTLQFFCQWCGYSEAFSNTCKKCKQKELKEIGDGTQQVEKDLKKMFPNARIARADKDTIGGKTSAEEIFEGFENGNYDILLGTQMITKGFQFSNVELVVAVLPDIDLYASSFRSNERTLQNLINLKNRLSTNAKKKEYIIQTHIPEHPVIQCAKTGNIFEYIKAELQERKHLFLPPFSKVHRFTFVDRTLIKAEKKAKDAKKILEKHFPNEKINLLPSPFSYKRGEFHSSLLLFLPPDKIFPQQLLPKGSRTDPYGEEM